MGAETQVNRIRPVIRESVTLPPVRTPKVVTVHLVDSMGGAGVACGRKRSARVMETTGTADVTCKHCQGTRRFVKLAERVTRQAAQATWAEAGLAVGMVVRQVTTGRLGMINELSDRIRVGFWSGTKQSAHYARLADFNCACQIITAEDLVNKGTVLVSNLGGECTVEEVGASHVWAYVKGETAARAWTLSELAAEISRGWLAVVPTAPYIRPDGTRQAVTMADMVQVGMRVNYGYGSANNGDVVAVSWHAATVKRADGTQYLLTLVELVRELNRANVSTYMPDANGRPIGS